MRFLFITIFAMITLSVSADDAVTERVSCADIQARISELSAVVDAGDEVLAEIADLKTEYRRNCSRSAGARRTSADARGSVVVDVVESEPVEEVATEQPPVIEEVSAVVEEAPVLTVEQELANLDAGLCADGTKPNRFGCCGDEIFNDLGDTVFACCPRDGGADTECFPPIK